MDNWYSAILGLVEKRKRIPDRQPQSQLEGTATAFLRMPQDALEVVRLLPPAESRPRHRGRGREPRYCGLISSSRRKFPFLLLLPLPDCMRGRLRRGALHTCGGESLAICRLCFSCFYPPAPVFFLVFSANTVRQILYVM